MKLFPAVHSSSFDDGSYGGNPCSFLVNIGGDTVFHAGDTALFSDMSLIADEGTIDAALLPIGGTFTMDLKDALRAARLLRARVMVPMHYDTWPLIAVDRDVLAFAADGEKFTVNPLKPGERLVL